MNRVELYNNLVATLPVKRNNSKDYKELVNDLLKNFCEQVETYDEILPRDLEDIVEITNAIKDIVVLVYEGRDYTAFQKLYDLMDGEHCKLIHVLQKHITNDDGNFLNFYRMRKFENRRNISYKEMFHIPFGMRGKVTTQRYSIPGYPCLYLGESTYGCWEEIGRPPLSSCMVSKYKTKDHLLLIDLTIPTKECLNHPNTFLTMLWRYPFILVCMIPVKDESSTFKPEYLFPQLLMKYIIEKYHKSKNKDSEHNYKGIYYTSVYKNSEFDFPENVFNNYAITTLETTQSTNFCPVLCRHFKLTNPTCEEYERIRTATNSDLIWNDERSNYEKSSFGLVERALNDEKRFPMNNILPKKL